MPFQASPSMHGYCCVIYGFSMWGNKETTLTESLLYVKHWSKKGHCSKYFSTINSFNRPAILWDKYYCHHLFYRWRNKSIEKSRNACRPCLSSVQVLTAEPEAAGSLCWKEIGASSFNCFQVTCLASGRILVIINYTEQV